MAESGDISQGSGQTLQGSDPKVRKRVHWDPREGPLRSSDGRSLREAPEWMVSKETDWGYGLEAQSVGLAAALDVMREPKRRRG